MMQGVRERGLRKRISLAKGRKKPANREKGTGK
jgi:hypothetical protein